MKTASFRTYRGPGRISIARSMRFAPTGWHWFPALKPGPWFKQVARPEYLVLYAEILDRLDPARTWDQLHALAGDDEPVLMCWEVPPFTERNWCHRRIVAEWFQDNLGHQVDELVPVTAQLALGIA